MSGKRSAGSDRRVGADGKTEVLQEGGVESLFDSDSFSPPDQLCECSSLSLLLPLRYAYFSRFV